MPRDSDKDNSRGRRGPPKGPPKGRSGKARGPEKKFAKRGYEGKGDARPPRGDRDSRPPRADRGDRPFRRRTLCWGYTPCHPDLLSRVRAILRSPPMCTWL